MCKVVHAHVLRQQQAGVSSSHIPTYLASICSRALYWLSSHGCSAHLVGIPMYWQLETYHDTTYVSYCALTSPPDWSVEGRFFIRTAVRCHLFTTPHGVSSALGTFAQLGRLGSTGCRKPSANELKLVWIRHFLSLSRPARKCKDTSHAVHREDRMHMAQPPPPPLPQGNMPADHHGYAARWIIVPCCLTLHM